jgi:hypothetical protein
MYSPHFYSPGPVAYPYRTGAELPLFTSGLEEEFSETQFAALAVLGNWASGVWHFFRIVEPQRNCS